jgi:hypothetical protein
MGIESATSVALQGMQVKLHGFESLSAMPISDLIGSHSKDEDALQ